MAFKCGAIEGKGKTMTEKQRAEALEVFNDMENYILLHEKIYGDSEPKFLPHIQRARETIRSCLIASSWQPISTAPRDGTAILVGCFNKGNSWCASDMWCGDNWLNHDHCSKILTHWQPLPDKPKEILDA